MISHAKNFGGFSLVALAVLVGACSGDSRAALVEERPIQTQLPSHCVSGADALPWENLGSTSLRSIEREDALEMFAAEYPLPGPTQGLWTQWGQGVVADGGRHFSAVGDHLGVDGNSHFFVYDPDSRELTRFMDVLSVIDRPPGSWGFGKVHAQMMLDRCQNIWAATYWGTRRGITNYEGDHMVLIDPQEQVISDYGVISEGRGIPSMTITSDLSVLVVEAIEPESDSGLLVSWDTTVSAVAGRLEDARHTGYRALAVAKDGDVLFSVGSGELAAWDVDTGTSSTFTTDLPGEWMRAATQVRANGSIVGATQDPPRLFSISGTGEVEELGDPGGYTTSLALDEHGDRVFWMAKAHGGAWENGAPVMSLDLGTGEISEVIRLRPSFETELGLLPGGTYSIAYDKGRLFMGVNSSDLSDDSGFGTVVLVVIEGL